MKSIFLLSTQISHFDFLEFCFVFLPFPIIFPLQRVCSTVLCCFSAGLLTISGVFQSTLRWSEFANTRCTEVIQKLLGSVFSGELQVCWLCLLLRRPLGQAWIVWNGGRSVCEVMCGCFHALVLPPGMLSPEEMFPFLPLTELLPNKRLISQCSVVNKRFCFYWPILRFCLEIIGHYLHTTNIQGSAA